jgi:AraC family transcriptional regulator
MSATQHALRTPGGSWIRVMSYEPRERHPCHAHSKTTITLVVRGGLEERVGSRVELAGPLGMVVKPAGTEHADAFGPAGATTLQVTLSTDDASRLDAGSRALHAWRWMHTPAGANAMLALLRMATGPREPATGAEDLVEERLREMIVAVAPSTDSSGSTAPAWISDVCETLIRDDASIRTIAGRVGVHPVHLAHVFRRQRGMSPSQYRRGARLHRAAALIVDSARPLIDIAYECGFADQAHMTRTLHAALGETPRGLRRLARAV